MPIEKAMLGTAVLDILVGFFLLVDYFTWVAAFLGAAHLVIILTVSGITDITVRDIGLLAAAIAVMVDGLPNDIKNKIVLFRKKSENIFGRSL